MASKIVIQTLQGELEISKEIGFGIQYSIDEISDPIKRNSSYSKTITLPGTKNNNYLLGYLFDVNETFDYFNPNIKTTAKIYVDSTLVLDGFMQLVEINVLKNTDLQGNQIEYQVVVYDNAVDFFSEVKDKYLSDLDFSKYNHIYNYSNITKNWASANSDDIYCYPVMYKGVDNYVTSDFKPAIFHKAYLKKIAEDAGFILTGTLMDPNTTNGAIYDKEIIPFNGDIPAIPEAEYERREFKAGITAASTEVYSTILKGGLINNNQARINYPLTAFNHFDDDTTSPNFDPNNHWNTLTGVWDIDANGSYNLKSTIEVEAVFRTYRDDITNISGSSSHIFVTFAEEHGFSSAYLRCQLDGTTNYDGDHTGGFVYDANQMSPKTIRLNGIPYVGDETGSGATFSWDAYQQTYNTQTNWWNKSFETNVQRNGNFGYRLNADVLKNGLSVASAFSSLLNVPRASVISSLDMAIGSVNNYRSVQKSTLSLTKNGFNLVNGDEISLKFGIGDYGNANQNHLKYVDQTASISISKPVPVIVEFNLISTGSSIYNEANNRAITDGDTIYLNQFIPQNVKQQDLIADLVKRYNVFISTNPDDDKKLILDSRDDFYAKGSVIDWTQKKDYSSEDKIELLSDLQNKEMLFTYKEDDDDWNKNYSLSLDGAIYGQQNLVYDNEFLDGQKKIETPFSPTPLVYNSPNKVMPVPSISAIAPKNNIRVLYFGGSKNTISSRTWTFTHLDTTYIGTAATTTSVVTTLNTYPYAGHYDDPYNPFIDINFGEVPYEWYAELETTTDNTQYQRCWNNYANQIAEGKLVTSKFYLTETDVAYIKFNMNAKIFVKDSYYYISRIIDYDPTKKGLTKVELIKIVNNFSYVPKKTRKPPRFNDWTLEHMSATDTVLFNPNVTNSTGTIINGANNYIGSNSNNTTITGDANQVGDNVVGSGIVGGSGNTIDSNVNNSWIIGGNDKEITQSNEIWIGDIHIVNGNILLPYNIIDGGNNSLTSLFPKYPINLLDGGLNQLRASNYTNVENFYNGNV